jgi:hypothetical protein
MSCRKRIERRRVEKFYAPRVRMGIGPPAVECPTHIHLRVFCNPLGRVSPPSVGGYARSICLAPSSPWAAPRPLLTMDQIPLGLSACYAFRRQGFLFIRRRRILLMLSSDVRL